MGIEPDVRTDVGGRESQEPEPVPVLEVRGVNKRFGGVRALCDVDLRIYPHEAVGLVGGNGAGKSTLIKVISGALLPDSGHLRVQGRPVTIKTPQDAREAGIETVYQDLAILPNLDAAANIFLGRELLRPLLGVKWLDERRMHSRAKALLDELKYDFDVRKPVRLLSGGQRQAVALARAVHFRATTLLMDEPTAALGVEETRRTLDLIGEFKQKGASLIIVSHDMEDIFDVTDRIVVMKSGRVVGDRQTRCCTPEEIVQLMMMGEGAGEAPRD